ncbi:structural maintenance of chromosome (SMC ATPase family) isoform 2 [Galdieria sulphuraria]|uniref:Structural maintenance of chromosome (SMC ATPase family) isoform 2 n=1 Tax=Galdieria sulphuraria TaxID=130081 RepID=M2W5G5_GALSU|nr:structural maintenance of chromosome (SMC ATPase family) isoform 2 [Galdieria sulphuraria]EME31026.1 structural maintenance of chromosome (SMC ATPase family) isoform 2 [Galdieria sulphuraria]|eukprot:XP_005707546.1 structural maintenance of chromosome (SMC ATPase family) isoform 2 [Galdieria sulphuraria]
MYIEEIIIEGFKSYATRTHIGPFDLHFNAITGFNGSGKSNILDAICFVMGITSLSHLRASSLQELIYKQGQSGVHKASVTIIFNNTNKQQTPPGYENCEKITVTRQILTGGRSKYLVNGHVSQPTAVQNLFQSVQLNVNNPHFLIMQGRITKVINMKPQEVVAMIEEAAGTRMYEMKREAALKTISKKDKKLEEIDELFQNQITPTLEKLRKERANYMQWVTNQEELEKLRKWSVLAEFHSHKHSLERLVENIKDKENKHKKCLQEIEEKNQRMYSIEQQLNKANESSNPRTFKEIRDAEEKMDQLSKQLVKTTTFYENYKDSYNREKNEHERNVKSLNGSRERRKQLVEYLDNLQQILEQKRKELDRSTQRLEKVFQFGDAQGLDTKKQLLQDEISDAENDRKQLEYKIKRVKGQLENLEKGKTSFMDACSKETDSLKELEQQKAKLVNELNELKVSIHDLDFDKEGNERLLKERDEHKAAIQQMTEKLDALKGRLNMMDFQYDKKSSGLDDTNVHGMIAQLFQVPHLENDIQVVVDTEQTAKRLLERGHLPRKVTIIPLNRIHSKVITQDKLQKIENICPDARLALSLIEFEAYYEPAMKFVFGNIIICPDTETANQISFHPDIKVRTVTLQGDIYDPAGTLTGGSTSNAIDKTSILESLMEMTQLRKQIASHERHVEKLDSVIRENQDKESLYRELVRKQNIMQHEIQLLESRLETFETTKVSQKLLQTDNQIQQLLHEHDHLQELLKVCQEKIKKLEEQLRSSDQDEVESPIERLKSEQQQLKKETEDISIALQTTQLELTHLKDECERLENVISSSNHTMSQMEIEMSNLQDKQCSIQQSIDELNAHLNKLRQQAKDQNKEVVALETEKNELFSKLETLQVEMEKETRELDALRQHQESIQKRMKELEKKFPRIEEECYSYRDQLRDISQYNVQDQLSSLEKEQSRLDRVVNRKVSSMFEQAEQEYQDLLRKKRIVENDRRQIQAVIKELDEKKILAVEKTWNKVNQDLASIFSSLLPGSSAYLKPLEEKSILEGLEIQVALNNSWKKNLSELSGGQRSLVALSLILALLRYKPAPLYILDEVDAALDLSHTQNIGTMLRKHFGHSQFIVVSLKEGMFQNANILFRTKLVDGTSTVERTIGDKENMS